MTEITSGGGIVKDALLGEMQIYREFRPRLDAIEYTIFFRRYNTKYRMDFTLKSSAFKNSLDNNGEISSDYIIGYVTARIHERFEREDYIVATEYFKKEQNQGYVL